MPYSPSAVAGRVLSVSASSPISYAAVPGIEALQYSGGAKNRINVTTISDEAEKSVPGRRGSATLAFNLFYDPAWATHQSLLANFNLGDGTQLAFQDVMDDAGDKTRTFTGYVEQWDETADRDGANMVSVVIRVDGDFTDTP